MASTALHGPTDFARTLETAAVRYQYDAQARLFSLWSNRGSHAPDIFVEWLQGAGAVRVYTWVLRDIDEHRLADVALCVARINHGLLVPGFVLDIDARWVAWRGVTLLDDAGAVASAVPATLIHLARRASKHFADALHQAATRDQPGPTSALPPWAVEAPTLPGVEPVAVRPVEES